jgi:molybdopterin molybdotransferase
MLDVEDAQTRIISVVEILPAETLPLLESAGRILRESISSPLDLPPADVSAMDGYAVTAAATSGASTAAPARLRRIGSLAAGHQHAFELGAMDCVRVFTGSWLPRDTDAVVMQEDTRVAGDWVEVLDAVKPFENVRLKGEDVARGQMVARSGERISAGIMGLLGALGVGGVPITRPPVIGLVATGDELVEAGQPLRDGQIYESNRAMIATLLASCGARPHAFPVVRDSPAATQTVLAEAFAECDAVITSGGVSVGEHDHVKAAFEAMGGRLEFWKVSMKPGKPFVFGRFGRKLFFGLPGNPVSAFVTFLLLVRPALLKMQGASDLALPGHPGVLAEAVRNRGDRRHYLRVLVGADGSVRSAGRQASHALSSMARANGLLALPAETSWEAGTSVNVLRWEL